MKKISFLLTISLLSTFAFFSACKDDTGGGGGTNVQDILINNGPWLVVSATPPGPTDNEVTITFLAGGTFSVANAGSMPSSYDGVTESEFPSGGQWTLTGTTAGGSITLGSLTINYSTISATNFNFTYNGKVNKAMGTISVQCVPKQ